MTDGRDGSERLELRHRYPQPPEAVFDAWTDAEGMGRWMRAGPTTGCRAELDVREGGRYTIVMVSDEREVEHTGEYRVIDRPRRLVFTWNAAHLPGETVVTLDFRPADGGTELVLVHEGLPDEQSVQGHTDGWRSILDELEGALAAV